MSYYKNMINFEVLNSNYNVEDVTEEIFAFNEYMGKDLNVIINKNQHFFGIENICIEENVLILTNGINLVVYMDGTKINSIHIYC